MSLKHRVRLAACVLLQRQQRPDEPPLRPIGDPWFEQTNCEARVEAALSIFDDDVVGFLLLTLHAGGQEVRCRTNAAYVLEQSWWPHVHTCVTELTP